MLCPFLLASMDSHETSAILIDFLLKVKCNFSLAFFQIFFSPLVSFFICLCVCLFCFYKFDHAVYMPCPFSFHLSGLQDMNVRSFVIITQCISSFLYVLIFLSFLYFSAEPFYFFICLKHVHNFLFKYF